MSLPGEHKKFFATNAEVSCLVRVQCRVHKQGDAFLSELPHILGGLMLSRPPSLKWSEGQGLLFVMPANSLVVDSTFEQSENIAIAYFLVVSSSSCCWPAVGVWLAYTIIGSKFVSLSSTHIHCTNNHCWHAAREMIHNVATVQIFSELVNKVCADD